MKERNMGKQDGLLDKLMEYAGTDMYPFHMPGHKRTGSFPNPLSVDITEIEGFDNLHHPEGVLKESMEWAASLYGSDRTYYLVNGSSSGILAAISAAVPFGGRILMARGSHKSAYHGVVLGHLNAEYIYPQIVPGFGIQGGLSAADVESMLKTHRDIKAVFIVSPTYDGIVSDIKAIGDVVHQEGIPLIVDEAHGAHLHYGSGFPMSALELGADVVIQSLHKTLPSFTQTAIFHVNGQYVDISRLERYLQIYQSSSPSYVFLAGIETCIRFMSTEGRMRMEELHRYIEGLRVRLKDMRCLKLLGEEWKGKFCIFDMDLSKIVVSCAGTSISGSELSALLRDKYHLEMEMCGADYVTAITTVCDSQEGFERLGQALSEIDEMLCMESGTPYTDSHGVPMPVVRMALWEAMDASWEQIAWEQSIGRISGEFVYLYPPGIPVIVPGEEITQKTVELIWRYKELGLPVQGPADMEVKFLRVIKEECR